MKIQWKMLIFAAIILSIVGIYVIQKNTDINPVLKVTTPEKTFSSKLINLSFRYPANSVFIEENIFKEFKDSVGKIVTFKNTNGAENAEPFSFDAVTANFDVTDSATHDLFAYPGVVDFSRSTSYVFNYNILGGNTQSKLVQPGMLLIAGYNHVEGTISFPIYLIVEPPKGSGLKYLSFYLGDNYAEPYLSEQESNDFSAPTGLAEENLRLRLSNNINEELPLIKDKLAQAISLAKTFKTTTNTEKIITLSSPESGIYGVYGNLQDVHITGTTKPGYIVRAYVNQSNETLQCISDKTIPNGGTSQADEKGNFDFVVDSKTYDGGSRESQTPSNALVVAAFKDRAPDTISCTDASSVSEPVFFSIYFGVGDQ